ncbi:hypothetical protein [Streptomyces sp. NPDC055058]
MNAPWPQADRHLMSVPCGMMTRVNTEMLIDVWQRLLADPRKSWVLFEHGTCVVLAAPEGELAEQAPTSSRSSARSMPVLQPVTSG